MKENANNNNFASSAAAGSGNDPYKTKDPYANNNDPYANKNTPIEKNERKKPWELDFEIVRFFRENFNAGIDFEESPRNFFDEQYMLDIRIRLVQRNFLTVFLKFITMCIFSIVTLFLSTKTIFIAGIVYVIIFLYYIAAPMAFVKYTRQYIVDDSEKGKLKKQHDVYANLIRPLEFVAMNVFTIFFMLMQITLYIGADKYVEIAKELAYSHINNQKIINFINSITTADVQTSSSMVLMFYAISYLAYYFFIYKIWSPKWEKAREENEKAYKIANQRMAKNLKDALTSED